MKYIVVLLSREVKCSLLVIIFIIWVKAFNFDKSMAAVELFESDFNLLQFKQMLAKKAKSIWTWLSQKLYIGSVVWLCMHSLEFLKIEQLHYLYTTVAKNFGRPYFYRFSHWDFPTNINWTHGWFFMARCGLCRSSAQQYTQGLWKSRLKMLVKYLLAKCEEVRGLWATGSQEESRAYV